jgi:Polyprenyltransferase (cytochrome oxidase assembly factor)
MAIALSSFTGALFYGHSLTAAAVYSFIGVFLLSSAASTLNQYQERDLDKLMSRTRTRPIPTGQISPKEALLLTLLLTVLGASMLYWETSFIPMILGLFNMAWYNLVYTPLKRRTSFALLAGSVNGAIPPMIGWTAAGGQVTDWQIVLIASFMFLWQIPHFWLLSIRYAEDYKLGRIPSFNLLADKSLVNPILFIWVLCTALCTMLFPLLGLITSPKLAIALMLIDISVISYFAMIVFNKKIFKPRAAFLVLTGFQTIIFILLIFEASL